MNLSECQKQAWAGCEANIYKASFIERRLFYLNRHVVTRKAFFPTRQSHVGERVLRIPSILLLKSKLCYKGMQ